MSSAKIIDTFGIDRATELLEFSDMVGQYLSKDRNLDAQLDLSSLQTAAYQCRSTKGNSWSYKIVNLMFPNITLADSGLRHHKPKSTFEYQVLLSVEAYGLCLEDNKPEDPLCDLKVDIVVIGRTEGGEEFTSGWHLDSQPGRKEKERRANPVPIIESTPFISKRVNHTHPRYHLQAGGDKVWNKQDEEFGSQLLLSSPRIAHPPLDAILAIDFVLSNYYGHSWEALRKNEARYRELVTDAQSRYWRPYYAAIASMWDTPASPTIPWPPHPILPNLPQKNF